jgi:hypothetical protein
MKMGKITYMNPSFSEIFSLNENINIRKHLKSEKCKELFKLSKSLSLRDLILVSLKAITEGT